MKKTLLTLALLTAINAHATWDGGNALTQSQNQSQQANSVGGNSDSSSSNRFLMLPPALAIAPSQSINTSCQVATPQSDATTLLFLFSHSRTTGVEYNDVCYALMRGDNALADKLMCLKSTDYAKVNGAICK